MHIDEILAKLESTDPIFQRDALEQAILLQEEITPALLRIVEAAANTPFNLDYYSGLIYAMYLLAQFREQKAYPLIVRYFGQLSTDDDELQPIADIVTEDLKQILASVCGNDLSMIKQLIENPQHNQYVRSGALEALVILYNCEQLTRADLITYLKQLIANKLERVESYIWSCLANIGCEIHPEEIYAELADCFASGYINQEDIGIQDVHEYLEKDKDQVIAALKASSQFHFIDNAIEEMEWWACFNEQDVESVIDDDNQWKYTSGSNQTYINEFKVGRNDPCPCGSGKKFKKCCLH